jgi:hypothetical protein
MLYHVAGALACVATPLSRVLLVSRQNMPNSGNLSLPALQRAISISYYQDTLVSSVAGSDFISEFLDYVSPRWPPTCSIDPSSSNGFLVWLGVWKMEPPHLNRPVSRDRGVSESFAMRPRAGSEVDPAVSRPSTRGADENRSPAALPRAFESMLKTTTETGDIDMFSIKPSRVPQSTGTPRRMGVGYNENLLQRSRQTFRPFGVPIVDDRRRLPSYTMDATSEVISMYETASQKSASRVFDDPDYRSYSMTQTSYSAYTLSNNRSYASLRSQQDGNGLLQRPRSPFAYPARLKRPGFRPSSPALTDGGVVDYSRRAEIDRTTYVSCPTRRLFFAIPSVTSLKLGSNH